MNINPNDQIESNLKNSYYKLIQCFEEGTKNEEKLKNFESFLDSSQVYLQNTKKYANNIPFVIFDTALKYPNLYSQQISILLKILRIINLAYDPTNKVQNFKIDQMKQLFEYLIKTDEINNVNVKKEIGPFFITITKSQNSIQEFLSKNGLLFAILDIILNNEVDNETWVTDTFMENIDNKSFDSKNSIDFCSYYSKIDSNSKKLIFLTTFFLNFSLKFNSTKIFSKIAMESGAFSKYIYFVYKLGSKSWSGYYEPFIFDNKTNTTNNYFITTLFNSCLKIPMIQENIFETISKIFLSTKIFNKDLNSYFPLQRVILEFQLPIDTIIYFLLKLDNLHPSLIQFCLEPYFKKITIEQQKNKNCSSDLKKLYNSLYKIVFHQIELKIFNEEKLISIGFIETFVTSLDSEILVSLIGNFRNFSVLVFNMTQLLFNNNNIFITEKIFESFIKTSMFCDKPELQTQLNDFCCNFFELSPSENNMRTFLNFMIDNKSLNLLTVLLSTIQNVKIGKSFIKSDGLDWLERSLNINLISIEKYSMLLGHLVCNQRFEEVDLHFLDLQKKKYFGKSEVHPLFVSNIEYLKQIVFGMNKSDNKPIRVYSLFHFLEIPKEIDPYNAWMLGKYSMDLLINRVKLKNKESSIYDVPLIKVIGNRFLNPEHVDVLLSSDPYNIRQFCDKDNYDHFPLYQFYRGNTDLKIAQPFTGLSFWFKFTGEIKQYCSFFSTNHISFSIRNQNELVIHHLSSPTEVIPKTSCQIKGQEDETLAVFEINPYDWNIVYIQKVEHFKSSTISIFISHYNRSNNYTHSKPLIFEKKLPSHFKFQMASFRRFSGGLMFLGPSIRFFGQFDKNSIQHEKLFKLIRNCGPGYTNKLKNASNIYYSSADIYNTNNLVDCFNVNNETIYLATEINITKKNVSVPNSCFLVPYFGFPYHFISIQKMAKTLFYYLRKSKTNDEFIKMLFSIIDINSITKVNSRIFWSILLDILHEIHSANPSFVTQQLIIILIKEIAYQKVYKYNNTILTRLFYNLKIWNSVDKEDLIQVIFNCFQDIDINAAIPDFSYFLSDLILKNPTNKEIIFTILNYHEKVPNSISNLANFLLMESPQVFNKTEEGDDICYRTDSSRNYDAKFMIQLKDTIISSISEFLETSTVQVVKKFFPFNDLNIFLFHYLTNNRNNEELSCKILHLIFQISIKDPSYFEISPFIMINAIFLSYNKMIMQDAFELICGDPELQKDSVLNIQTLPLLLSLTWSSFVVVSHVELFQLENLINIRYFFENCYRSIELCMKYANYIVNSNECLMILTIWFPAAFKSALTINEKIRNCKTDFENNGNWKDVYYFNNKNKEKNIIEFLIGQILDNFHIPVEIEETKDINIFDINFSSKKIIDCYSLLLLEIIFKIQPNSPKSSLASSFTFLLSSPSVNNKIGIQLFDQLFSSLALCAPFIDDLWIKNQSLQSVNMFIDTLLKKPNKNFCFIERFFKYLGFILWKTTDGKENLMITKKLLSNSFFSDYYPKEIDNILFQIFKKTTINEEIELCYKIFEENKKSFIKVSHSAKFVDKSKNIEYDGSIAWAYLFFTKLQKSNVYKNEIHSFDLIPSYDRANFEQWLKNDNNEFPSNSLYPYLECYQNKSVLIQKYFDEISNQNDEIKQKYIEYTKVFRRDMDVSINQYTSKLFTNNRIIEDQIKNLEISLFLFYEEKNWNNFMTDIKLRSSLLPLFNPYYYLISSQCLPFQFPKLLKPFISIKFSHQKEENFLDVFEKKFTINFEMDALKNIKTIKMKQTASQSLNNLVDEINSTVLKDSEESNEVKLDVYNCFKKHFEIQYGKIQHCINCKIELYEVLIVPSVLFIFANSTMMILTYAKITTYETQSGIKSYSIRLKDQAKESDFQQFITFVFNQQFGKTTLFFSHVVINLPITDLIKTSINLSSKAKNSLYFLIWTFSSGHFVLSIKCSQFEKVRSIFERSTEIKYLNNFIEKSIPDLFLFKIKSTDVAIKNWINQSITNEELIFYLNGIKGCSFVLFSIFPEIPCVGKCEGENAYSNTMLNYFNSFINDKIQNDNIPLKKEKSNLIQINKEQESCSISELHQEEFNLNRYDIRDFLENRFNLTNIQQQTKKERKFIADFNSIHVHQVLNSKSIFSIKLSQFDKNKNEQKTLHKISKFNSKRIAFIGSYLFYLSELEALLPNNYIIRISRELMNLQIIKVNFDGSSSNDSYLSIRNEFHKCIPYCEIYSKFDPIFSTATQINASKDGLYIVVDFDIGMSRAYRIFYTNGEGSGSAASISKPITVVIASETLLDNSKVEKSGCNCSSCISSSYSVAATRDGRERIVMWCVQPFESTLCLPSSSDEAATSQTFWATPAPIHRVIDVNDKKLKIKANKNETINNIKLNETEMENNESNKDETINKKLNESEVNPIELNESEVNQNVSQIIESNENEVNEKSVNEEIVLFKLDEEDGLWAATRTRLIFYSLNAEKIAELCLASLFSASKYACIDDFLVTAIEVVTSPLNEPFAIVGFSCGQMILASPRFDVGEIEYKKLNSPHESQITSISINKMNKCGFVAVDSSKNVSYWSVMGSCSDAFSFKRFEKCAICKKNNAKFVCSSCNLGICPNCFLSADSNYSSKQSLTNKCIVCSSIERFIYE